MTIRIGICMVMLGVFAASCTQPSAIRRNYFKTDRRSVEENTPITRGLSADDRVREDDGDEERIPTPRTQSEESVTPSRTPPRSVNRSDARVEGLPSSPVPPRESTPKGTASREPNRRVQQSPPQTSAQPEGDTVVIPVAPDMNQRRNTQRTNETPEQRARMLRRYEAALKMFDAGEFVSAEREFRTMLGLARSRDSLYHEMRFMVAESQLMQQRYEGGLVMLEEILRDESSIPVAVVERALLRRGQALCLLNKPRDAERVFEEFKRKFPRSRFLRLANCASVRG